MDRTEFRNRIKEIRKPMTETQLKQHTADHTTDDDLNICHGELAELSLEITRFQRGKYDPDDFLQELSHVQWAVWKLQQLFRISDEELLGAIQASFR